MTYIKACQFFLQYGNIDIKTYELAIHKPIKKFSNEQLKAAYSIALENGEPANLVEEAKQAIINYE